MTPLKTSLFAFALLLFASPAFSAMTQAQQDSGWVELFNGTDLSGFFTMFGGTKGPADAKGVFSVQGGNIHATGTGGSGYLETEKKYSYYRWRADFKFATTGGNANAGLMYHIHDEVRWVNDATWPRGIEAQGQKNGVGDMWTIGLVIANTRVASGSNCKYQEGGIIHVFGAGNQTNDRKCQASELRYVDGDWNTEEVWAWGSDSVYHLVNGKIVFKAWNLRWSDQADIKDLSHPLKDGGVAVQSEGGEISYRNLHMMELDPVTLKAINAKPTGLGAAIRGGGSVAPVEILGLDGRRLPAAPRGLYIEKRRGLGRLRIGLR